MQYQSNQSIIVEGSTLDGVFVIYSGVVKLTVKGHRSRTFIVRLAKPGEIIGHTADQSLKQPTGVTAVEPTIVCFIENKDFELGLNHCPGVRDELMSIYKNEIKHIGHRTIQLVQMSVREKIAEAVLHISKAYGLREGGSEKHFMLSRQDIADMTGTTKEQVSKIMSEFKQEKIIRLRGKNIAIMQHERLKKIAGLA